VIVGATPLLHELQPVEGAQELVHGLLQHESVTTHGSLTTTVCCCCWGWKREFQA
jgi:hypothetical protein